MKNYFNRKNQLDLININLFPTLIFLLISLFLTGCSKDDEIETETNTEIETPIEIIAFENTSFLNLPGNSTSDVWGFRQAGKEYAVVGDMTPENYNFSIIEVTNPDNPKIVSTTSYPAFDMKVWQNFLYVVNGGHDETEENMGMIYNIQNPAAPVAVGKFPSSHNIFIDNRGYLYLSGRHQMVDDESQDSGITIYDLNNDPTEPQLVWTSSLSPSHDMAVVGERMFDFHGEMGTLIYDVSNPSAPVLLSTLASGKGYDHSGWPTQDGNFLFITNEYAASSQFNFTTLGGPDIAIWDISNISTPVKVGEIQDESSRVHNLYIKDNLAYISYYSAGFKIFDVADPGSPVLLYEFDTNGSIGAGSNEGFNGAFGVYPFSSTDAIYVSDINSGLFIFESNR